MRNGHQHQNNKRMRGRNNNNNRGGGGGGGKGHNPLTRVYESNGPDVKIRGTANHVAEKYVQLARDATSSGDPVAAENYFQHAEHYFRLIAAAQEQFRQSQPFPRPDAQNEMRDDGNYEDGDEEGGAMAAEQPTYGTREPQPYSPAPRDNQFYQQPQPPREAAFDRPREQQNHDRQNHDRRPVGGNGRSDEETPGLPSFITGSGPAAINGNGEPNGQNGFEGGTGDRFPLHRRRRRHRGPRPEMAGAPPREGDGPSE